MDSHGVNSGPDDGTEDEFSEELLDDTETGQGSGDAAALHRVYQVPDSAAGTRIDKVLAEAFADLSRARVQSLLAEHRVTADRQTIKDAARRVKSGEVLEMILPPPAPAVPQAEAIPLAVLYEDDHLLVLDKPPGLVVHPAAGHARGTLVNALLAHCGEHLSGIGGVARPGIVHRLDKDTSGLMVVAKTEAAHRGLAIQFRDHSLSRTYHALTWGVPIPAAGDISGAIGRSPQDRKRMAVLTRGGKPALTRYRTLHRYRGAVAAVACRLATGRTHQVRVHLAALGYPLVGDPVYGLSHPPAGVAGKLPPDVAAALAAFPRQALHAAALTFAHPITGETLSFEAGLPQDMADLFFRMLPWMDS